MNTPYRARCLTAFLAVWLLACAPAAGAPMTPGGDDYFTGPQTPTIRVLVFDRARVGEDALTIALKKAGLIFRDAGVRLTWVRCPASSIGPVNSLECRSDGARVLIVRIMRRPMGAFVSRNALGFAVTTQGGSVYATVFRDRVLEIIALGGPCSEAVLLGHAIAHELGHLLLDSSVHARSGLMAGRWSRTDLDRAAVGLLNFSPMEATRMRTEALRRGT